MDIFLNDNYKKKCLISPFNFVVGMIITCKENFKRFGYDLSDNYHKNNKYKIIEKTKDNIFKIELINIEMLDFRNISNCGKNYLEVIKTSYFCEYDLIMNFTNIHCSNDCLLCCRKEKLKKLK